MSRRLTLAALAILTVFDPNVSGSSLQAQEKKTREQQVREDKQKVEAEGFWLYNDYPAALAKAKETGKPILVVLRCLPCHECVKLDDDLVEQDPIIRPLLDKFVCVRIVGTNGLDLKTFQYDTDQSFAVFMLNHEGTIYGRFGTRSHRTEWVGDVSLLGMGKALQGALDLHADYPNNKAALAGKRGPMPEVSSPEKYPALASKFTDKLNYEGNVVQSCIHCHQIGDAQRDFYWSKGQPIPEQVFYPYPHPKSVGLVMNPQTMATVKDVSPDSAAAVAGFQAGDMIKSLAGQPLVSIADLQWVLHQASPDGADIPAIVSREGTKKIALTLKLEKGWRQADDISWRVTSWGYRGQMCGGAFLEAIPAEERDGLPTEASLRIRSVGQYGIHAAAMKAGFQPGDVILAYDGQTGLKREADVHYYAATHLHPGDNIKIKILRNGETMELPLPIQSREN